MVPVVPLQRLRAPVLGTPAISPAHHQSAHQVRSIPTMPAAGPTAVYRTSTASAARAAASTPSSMLAGVPFPRTSYSATLQAPTSSAPIAVTKTGTFSARGLTGQLASRAQPAPAAPRAATPAAPRTTAPAALRAPAQAATSANATAGPRFVVYKCSSTFYS